MNPEKSMDKNKDCLKKAFLATIPVMAGYVVLGIGFGMLLQTRGYGALWALAMSLFIFAGSMQYVAIDLMTGGVSLLNAPYGVPELIACATVVGLHIWKRNTAVSIVGGTVLYMVLVQMVF